MTDLGPNLKLTVDPTNRGALRQLFDAVGCERTSPSDAWDLFQVTGGGSIGVNYSDGALAPEQARLGAWIELRPADLPAARARLAELGHLPFAYADEAHEYFEAPGGQVFRLAARP